MGVLASLAAIQTQVNGVQSIENATSVQVALIEVAIESAQAVTASTISSIEAGINTNGSVAGALAGAAPAAIASAMTAQKTAFGQLFQLYQIAFTLGRMNTNMAQIGN